MVSGIGSNVNSLQALRAINAFKSVNRPEKTEQHSELDKIKDTVDIQSVDKDFNAVEAPSLQQRGFDKTKIEDIKSVVQNADLSDEDIKYGLTYGRSVLVDFSA